MIGCFRPLDPADVVLGQYEGYRQVDGVAPDSGTDTFVAARLFADTPRWQGVPFLMRTGKRMAESAQQVTLVFRDVPGPLDGTARPSLGNVLRLSLTGSGGLDLGIVVKAPGPSFDLATGRAQFTVSAGDAGLDLGTVPPGGPLPPYATLLHDVLVGDRALFTSREGLRAAWRAAAPLLQKRPPVQPYAPGSWGPEAALRLPGGGWVPVG